MKKGPDHFDTSMKKISGFRVLVELIEHNPMWGKAHTKILSLKKPLFLYA